MTDSGKRSLIKIDATQPDGKEIKKTISFVSSYCRYFFNRQHLITELSSKELSFYEYLCEKMDSCNEILIDFECKEAYVAFISKVTSNGKFIQQSSLSRYITKLEEVGLIVLWGSSKSALYLVNPKYAFKGSETNRTQLLKKVIESKIKKGESTRPFIGQTEENFGNDERQYS